jgi:protein-tyrosine phosphatase
MFANVLIVCHANVCRSPAAEWLFRSRQHERGAQPIAFRSAGCARSTDMTWIP